MGKKIFHDIQLGANKQAHSQYTREAEPSS